MSTFVSAVVVLLLSNCGVLMTAFVSNYVCVCVCVFVRKNWAVVFVGTDGRYLYFYSKAGAVSTVKYM